MLDPYGDLLPDSASIPTTASKNVSLRENSPSAEFVGTGRHVFSAVLYGRFASRGEADFANQQRHLDALRRRTAHHPEPTSITGTKR